MAPSEADSHSNNRIKKAMKLTHSNREIYGLVHLSPPLEMI